LTPLLPALRESGVEGVYLKIAGTH